MLVCNFFLLLLIILLLLFIIVIIMIINIIIIKFVELYKPKPYRGYRGGARENLLEKYFQKIN